MAGRWQLTSLPPSERPRVDTNLQSECLNRQAKSLTPVPQLPADCLWFWSRVHLKEIDNCGQGSDYRLCSTSFPVQYRRRRNAEPGRDLALLEAEVEAACSDVVADGHKFGWICGISGLLGIDSQLGKRQRGDEDQPSQLITIQPGLSPI